MEKCDWSLLQERYRQVYQDVCAKLNLSYEEVDSEGHLLRITNPRKGAAILVPFSSWAPLNTVSGFRIARDKVLTKALLHSRGVSVPHGDHFFLREKGDWEPTEKLEEDAISFARELGYPVFVKPHDLSRAEGAQRVESERELVQALSHIRNLSHIAVIEEFIEAREGRIVCIDGEVQFSYYKKADPRTHIANLAAGGAIDDFRTDAIPEHLVSLGEEIFNAFEGELRFFAADFFELSDGSLRVLEVNSTPAMSSIWEAGHEQTVYDVFKRALEMYFEEEFLRPKLSLPILSRTST